MKSGKEIRAAKFAEAQAKLTAEQIEEQNQQNHALPKQALSFATLRNQDNAKVWFCEFMEDQHPDIDVQTTFFTPGSAPPDPTILKEYARYLARSREGRLADKLSVRTVSGYMEALISKMKNDAEHESLRNVHRHLEDFIVYSLRDQENLNTKMRPKLAAYSSDVTFILSKLYHAEYLNTFHNMRNVLNVNLYIILLIDLCGRGGEIAWNSVNPEHMCLKWKDIEFYTHQSKDDTNFDIRMKIAVHWAKGTKLDDSKFREVAFAELLPASCATEDTLRMLLVLALMDGVLDVDVKTWDDLSRLRVSPQIAKTGRRIPIKESMRDVPVIRTVDKSHTLTEKPALAVDIQCQIRRLGRYCGIETHLIGYCFRRGVAHTLIENVSVEQRMHLMGHSSADAIKPYLTNCSTVDTVRLLRGREPVSVLPQSSVLLNRSDDAPNRISEAGMQRVHADEIVKSLVKEASDIRNSILQKHLSHAAAIKANDPLCEKFKEIDEARKSRIGVLKRKFFYEEYNQHFQQLELQPFSVSGGTTNHISSDDVQVQPAAVVGQSSSLTPSGFSPTVNREMAILKDNSGSKLVAHCEEVIVISSDEDEEDISTQAPFQRCRRVDEIIPDSEQESSDSEYESSSSEPPDDVQSQTGNSNHENSDSMRMHGLPTSVTGRGVGRIFRKGVSAYQNMQAEMNRHGDDEAGLAQTLMLWFSVTHGIDDFPPGQEPLPGTYNCRFCGEDLSKIHHAWEHTQSCAVEDALERAETLRDQLSPLSKPCEYKVCGNRETFGTFVTCGETFETHREKGEHMRAHVRAMLKFSSEKGKEKEKVLTCFLGSCPRNPETGRLFREGPDFSSYDDLLHHVWAEHRVFTLKTINVHYYEYCSTFLLEPHEWRSHADRHLEDAKKVILEVGYTGELAGRAILPRICPFCFHNEDNPIHMRISTFEKTDSFKKHVWTHLRENTEANVRMCCPCFPSTCTKAEEMDTVQMKEHLLAVHKIDGNLKRGFSDRMLPTNKRGSSIGKGKGKRKTSGRPKARKSSGNKA